MLTAFSVGEKYTNDQIRFALGVENLGGIRPSIDNNKNLRHLAILTTAQTYGKSITDNPYHDRIEGDILIYTAQGRSGDQELTGRNKRIIEQYLRPIPFYCFSNEGKQAYTFLGLLELLRHYQEHQVDVGRSLRTVWVFEFRIHREIPIVQLENAEELAASFFEGGTRSNTEDRELMTLESLEIKQGAAVSYEAEETRARLLQINPYRFEVLVRDIVEANGFENVKVTPASQDGGIDIDAYVAESDYFFAKTHVQFQVKRWRHSVGSPDINGFRGALNTTAKGVFITTSHFTKAAIREAEHPIKPGISLIDGLKFSKLIKAVNVNIDNYL